MLPVGDQIKPDGAQRREAEGPLRERNDLVEVRLLHDQVDLPALDAWIEPLTDPVV